MKQLAQNIRTGEITVVDVSVPRQEAGKILVKVYSSALSPGTEKTTIDNRRSSLLHRARSQPDEVRKIVDEIRRTGFATTYKRVRNKLESAAALGYSNAGIVLAVDPSIQDIEIGDRVACAGAEYAFHSDVIAVPRNLLVKVPDSVPLDYAAFTTLGAIAMQGIRQTNPTLGETIVVIGLGIIGQLTIQMLKANGCKVIGIDIDPNTLVEAEKSGADIVLHRNNDPVESTIESATTGIGADAVIITAGTSSNDPVTLAGRVCRERGRVTIVGAVGMDIPRSVYYQKELEIRLSRSYGPGRYNVDYEKKGQDFPPAYVRWTMNRNMQAFVRLIAEGKVAMKDLITHTFSIHDAERAYELIAGEKTEFYLGILLQYEDLDRDELLAITEVTESPPVVISKARSPLCIGFIGAGSFATGYLIPHLQNVDDLTLEGVCNRTGLTAADVRNKFGFIFSTTNEQDILAHERIGTVFIATRHGSHFRLVKSALEQKLNVFVEKPLALHPQELEELERLYYAIPERTRPILMVGYNRRFAPLVREMKDFFRLIREPKCIQYHVNAGFIPKDHWIQDPGEGGGRIVGEVCHFIDTVSFLTDETPERLHAECIATETTTVTPYDNMAVTMRMSGGSVVTISYVANNDRSMPKETITMSGGNSSAIMNNFSSLVLARDMKQTKKRGKGDKGHKAEIQAFISAIREKRREIIPVKDIFITSQTTFKILESLNTKSTVLVNDPSYLSTGSSAT